MTIVAFGDSITETSHQQTDDRWPEILRRKLQENFAGIEIAVVNAGVGGNTSREGLARIKTEIAQQGPESCILPDGVHLTARSNECVVLAVLQVLSPEIENHLQRRGSASCWVSLFHFRLDQKL